MDLRVLLKNHLDGSYFDFKHAVLDTILTHPLEITTPPPLPALFRLQRVYFRTRACRSVKSK